MLSRARSQPEQLPQDAFTKDHLQIWVKSKIYPASQGSCFNGNPFRFMRFCKVPAWVSPILLLFTLLIVGWKAPTALQLETTAQTATIYYVNANHSDGLLAWYPFDEGGGALLDDASPYQHDGVVSGGLDYSGDVPPAIQFTDPLAGILNGGDNVVIQDAPELNPETALTAAVWLRSSSPVAQASKVVGKVPGTLDAGYLLGISQGHLDVEIWGQNGHARLTAGDLGDDWVHVAFTYQASGELRTYVNGSEVGHLPAVGPILPSDQVLLIGAAPWNTSSYRYNGDLDDLRLYDRALSGEEITLLASGTDHDGLSWADAFSSLPRALANAQAGDEIWVAQGVYKPSLASGVPLPRRETFLLPAGVAIYGGFSGSESELSQRNWFVNRSVLTGDLAGDDLIDALGVTTGPQDIVGSNAYHVVTISEVSAPTVLDGFTITAGAADDPELADAHNGAGLIASVNIEDPSLFILQHMTFQGNQSLGAGGGLFYQNDAAAVTGTPRLYDLEFIQNSAGAGGGLALTAASGSTLVNVSFFGNLAGQGGAIFSKTPVEIQNGVFSGNQAVDGGAIFADSAGHLRLANVTCSGNQAAASGGGVYLNETPGEIANSLLWGNSDGSGTGQSAQIFLVSAAADISYSLIAGPLTPGTGNLNTDPRFLRAPDPGDDDWSTLPDNDYGDLHLRADSPAVDHGSRDLLPTDQFDLDQDGITTEPLPLDRDGRDRVVYAQPDVGAFELQISFDTYLPLLRR